MRTLPILIALACAFAPAASWAAAAADGDHDGRCRERHEKMLAKYDTNHDGKLDESERAAAKADIMKHREEREAQFKAKHPELFAKIDTDGDGKIDHGEGRAWREAHKGEHRKERAN